MSSSQSPTARRTAAPSALWCIASALVLGSAAASAQDSLPDGPPWNAVCAPMEQAGFRQIFTSDQCQIDFEAAVASLDAPEAHSWMKDNRGCFYEWAHFSWLAFLRHDRKMARVAWDHQLFMLKTRLLGTEDGDLEALLQSGVTATIGTEAVAYTKAFLDRVELDQSFKEEMDAASAAVTPICLYHLDTQCVPAMNKLLGWMYPRSYRLEGPPREWFTFSMVPFYRQVFSDTATQRGASRLALSAMRLVEENTDGWGAGDPTRLASDIYTLGIDAFQGDEDRFWNFMMVYATRGAAWATAAELAHAETRPLFAAFMVISAAMGVLDTQAVETGAPWSYSPNAHSTCFQPKPYHYWMAGGYAHLLRREGFSVRTSRLVARLLGAMYELGSTTMDRDPNAVFFVPTFDTIVNRTRRELAHHYLGADFALSGAHAAAPQDFDATFLDLLQASEPLPDISDAEMLKRIEDAPTKWRYWTALTGYYF